MGQPPAATGANVPAVAPVWTREQIDIIKAVCAPEASDMELQFFLYTAGQYGLDPILKEIYFWKNPRKRTNPETKRYENVLDDKGNVVYDISLVTARDGYLKAAQRHPDYEGIQSMAVRRNDHFEVDWGNQTVKTHTFPQGERGPIIGAYAIAYRRGRRPVLYWVEMSEYSRDNSTWRQYPTSMICKVAEVGALRRQFNISGLVAQEELGLEPAIDITPQANMTAAGGQAQEQDQASKPKPSSKEQRQRINGIYVAAGHTVDSLKALIKERYNVDASTKLTAEHADELYELLQAQVAAMVGGTADDEATATKEEPGEPAPEAGR